MEDFVAFGTKASAILFCVLLFSRGADLLSTFIATPRMVLEGNPITKSLGWRWAIPINLALCGLFSMWPLPAVVISTTSVLIAARNFQGAWLMRSMGEDRYRFWHVERLRESNTSLYLSCLFAHSGLIALVGVAILLFADWLAAQVLVGIGFGIISYSVAVVFYSLLGFWRLRRNMRMEVRLPVADGKVSGRLQPRNTPDEPQAPNRITDNRVPLPRN